MQRSLTIATSFFIVTSLLLTASFSLILTWSHYHLIDTSYTISTLEALLLIAIAHIIPAGAVSFHLARTRRLTPPSISPAITENVSSRLKSGAALLIHKDGILTKNSYNVTSEWYPRGSRTTFKAAIASSLSALDTAHPIGRSLERYSRPDQKHRSSLPIPLKAAPNSQIDGTIRPHGHQYHVFLRGDTETILAMTTATEAEREKALLTMNRWESEGSRTLGICKLTLDKPITHLRELSHVTNGEFVGLIALKSSLRPNIAHIVQKLLHHKIPFHIVANNAAASAHYYAKKIHRAEPYALVDCNTFTRLSSRHLPTDSAVCWYANATKKDTEHLVDLLNERGDCAVIDDPQTGYAQLVDITHAITSAPILRLSKMALYAFIVSYLVQSLYIIAVFILDTFQRETGYIFFRITLLVNLVILAYALLQKRLLNKQ